MNLFFRPYVCMFYIYFRYLLIADEVNLVFLEKAHQITSNWKLQQNFWIFDNGKYFYKLRTTFNFPGSDNLGWGNKSFLVLNLVEIILCFPTKSLLNTIDTPPPSISIKQVENKRKAIFFPIANHFWKPWPYETFAINNINIPNLT